MVRVNGLAPATVVEGISIFSCDCEISSLIKYSIDFDDSEDTDTPRSKLAPFYAQHTLTKQGIAPADQVKVAYLSRGSAFSKTAGSLQRGWRITRGFLTLIC